MTTLWQKAGAKKIAAMLKDKNIVVVGLGLTGLSCVRFLQSHHITFAVNDSRSNPLNEHALAEFTERYPQVTLVLGRWDAQLISQADILLVSPGVDLATPIFQHKKPSCQLWGDVELYCRLTDTPILAVTGSNGKSTVVSLLAHLGQSLGMNAQLGGNIGVPVLDHLTTEDNHLEKISNKSKLNKSDLDKNKLIECLILELSSFQLESLTSMNAIAATVLNVSDDHLDRHLTMHNYQTIKLGIYQQCETAVINRDEAALTQAISDFSLNNANNISFGSDSAEIGHFGIDKFATDKGDERAFLMFGQQPLIAVDLLPIAGLHNALNCLAALALGYAAGWSLSGMVDNLTTFVGLPHRCQKIASDDEAIWINDSKATNVGATLAAINGLSQTMQPQQKLILIAGGEGKGADFSPLQVAINTHVDQLITLGKDGDKIAKLSKTAINVNNLDEAVLTANKLVKSYKDQSYVLLSPACASIDMFPNYMVRGQAFVDAVHQLKEAS